MVGIANYSSINVSSVTYNGTALTMLNRQDNPSSYHEEVWYLINPTHDGVAHSIAVTLSGNSSSVVMGATTYYNVDQTTPFGTVATNSGTAPTAVSLTVNTSPNQMVVDFVTSPGGDTLSGHGADQTQLWNYANGGSYRCGASSCQPASSGATTSFSWTITGSYGWVDIGVPLNPAPSSDLSNFPVLISISNDANLADKNHSGYVQNLSGYDIVFTASDGTTKLDHEIEKYDGTTGTLAMWVRMPTLSASSDTTLYLYFDNSSISSSQENKTGVWNPGGDTTFRGVWHFEESSGNALDSTSYAANAAKTGTPTQNATGRIGAGVSFSGSTGNYFNAGNPGDGHLDFGTNSFSYSSWVYLPSIPTSFANWFYNLSFAQTNGNVRRSQQHRQGCD